MSTVQSRPGQRVNRDERETGQAVDVDLRQVIALRANVFESETYRMVGSSVTDTGWLDQLPPAVLVVPSGVTLRTLPR